MLKLVTVAFNVSVMLRMMDCPEIVTCRPKKIRSTSEVTILISTLSIQMPPFSGITQIALVIIGGNAKIGSEIPNCL